MVAEAVGVLSPHVSANMRTSLLFSLIQQLMRLVLSFINNNVLIISYLYVIHYIISLIFSLVKIESMLITITHRIRDLRELSELDEQGEL